MKFLLTGGTGFIGGHLVDRILSEGHEAILVSRSERKSDKKALRFVKWNGKSIPESVGEVDVVINLAGAGIADKRWTDERKKLIINSRVDATQACVDFIKTSENKPKVFISASAVGFYGGVRNEVVDETSAPKANDFMSEVCQAWEQASEGAGIRTVNPRIGVVLGPDGGPLEVMMKPYKFFVGGPIASGNQGFPWVHVEDLVSAFMDFVKDEKYSGPVNIVAPPQNSQGEFAKELANVMSRPNLFRVPKFMLDLMLGESGIIVWGGQFVKGEVLKAHGFQFRFPDVKTALKDIID